MRRTTACLLASCAIALGLLPRSAGAQATTLSSVPPGAYVRLRGPLSLAGATPIPLGELPDGEYGLILQAPGRATLHGRVVRSELGLAPRSWAGAAALANPPGLLHLRRADNRGWIFLSGGIAAATMAVTEEAQIRSAGDDRERAERLYASSVSLDAIRDARGRILDAAQEEKDRREVRGLWIGYLAASWLGAGIEAWLLTPEPAIDARPAGEYVISVPAAGKAGAAWRSLLVPGAGQRYRGRTGRADFFLAATGLLGAGAIGAQDAFLDARRDQAAAQRAFDGAETTEAVEAARDRLQRTADRVDDRNTLRWALAGAAAGVYLWNVLDAFSLSGEIGSSSDLSWTVTPGLDGAVVRATWSVR